MESVIACRRAALKGIEAKQNATLLLHQLIKANPDADQDQ
jgi:hypothetical protein